MFLRLPPEDYFVLCQSVLKRDGFRCRNCGSRNNLHVHHIVFRSTGGDDVSENLCVLCNFCHDGVHHEVDAEGNPGLTIQTPADTNGKLIFIWGKDWHPGP